MDFAVTVIARKNAEDDFHASETRYRRLFESARDGILILDADTGQVVGQRIGSTYLVPNRSCLACRITSISPPTLTKPTSGSTVFSRARRRLTS